MNRSAVEEIKARLPIEDVIGSYIKIEHAGRSLKAKCPFHNEKTASFFISPERGGYYCFGCNAKGDIFTFVEQFEGLDFRGALKILADRAGVKLEYDNKADSERDTLLRIMEEATAYFEAQFAASKEAQEYVRSRGINDETRKQFRIGWAPDGWRNLQAHLKAKKYPNALVEKAGLIKKPDTDSQGRVREFYDRFRGRIMFPISDSSGRVVAFSGRILHDDGKSAKYINSPDTPLYDKSMVMFGLDKAKSEIRRLNYTILVEGQMDLVMSHQAGIKNTVASSGTALTDEVFNKDGLVSNLGLIRRLSPNVIIAFDSDAAGRKAAMRAAEIALSIGMDVKIADIVGGKDPADLVREDPAHWREVLKRAKQVIEFELGNVIREAATSGKDQRFLIKLIQSRVLPLLAKIESNSDQGFFVAMIADASRISTDVIWQDLKIVSARLKKESESGTAKSFSVKQPTMRTSSEISKRINLVERRIFGLLAVMEKEKFAKLSDYQARLQAVAGDSFAARETTAKSIHSDLLFEAEAFYGNDMKNWEKHMEDLLISFEEDIVNEELIGAMQDLKQAEKAGDDKAVAELAKKCQVLSLRKAEIGKKRSK